MARDDAAVEKVLLEISDEAAQIDAIADIRGWFSSGDGANDIVRNYMAEMVSVSEATEALAAPLDEAFVEGRHCSSGSMNGKPTAEGQLWELWFSVIHAARKIPRENTTGQDHLLDLVRSLKARPDPRCPDPKPANWIWASGKLWSNLNMLGPSARESWNDCPGCGAGWTKPELNAWLNVSAFVARLTAEDIHDFQLYGLWSLRDAFEENIIMHPNDPVTLEDKIGLCIRESNIWIELAGRYLWEHREPEESSMSDVNSDPTGVELRHRGRELPWHRSSDITKDRWNFWKLRAEEESRSEKLDGTTRAFAARTAELMTTIMKGSC